MPTTAPRPAPCTRGSACLIGRADAEECEAADEQDQVPDEDQVVSQGPFPPGWPLGDSDGPASARGELSVEGRAGRRVARGRCSRLASTFLAPLVGAFSGG